MSAPGRGVGGQSCCWPVRGTPPRELVGLWAARAAAGAAAAEGLLLHTANKSHTAHVRLMYVPEGQASGSQGNGTK